MCTPKSYGCCLYTFFELDSIALGEQRSTPKPHKYPQVSHSTNYRTIFSSLTITYRCGSRRFSKFFPKKKKILNFEICFLKNNLYSQYDHSQNDTCWKTVYNFVCIDIVHYFLNDIWRPTCRMYGSGGHLMNATITYYYYYFDFDHLRVHPKPFFLWGLLRNLYYNQKQFK